MKIFRIIIFLIFFGNMSCAYVKEKTEKADAQSLIYIKVEKPVVSSLKPLFLSEFVDSIEYIQLETNSKCLLPPNIGIHLTTDFIFTTSGSNLFQFDRTGKFIRQIGREGQGPGEFKLQYCGFDDNNHRILVISYYSREPLIFDYNGNFLGNVNDSIVSSCFGLVELFGAGNNYFICTIQPMDIDHQWAGKPYELVLYDFNKHKVTQTLTNRLVCRVEDAGWYNAVKPSFQTLVKKDSFFYYHSFYNDTLYSVSNSSIHPFAVIDFGKLKFSSNSVYSRRNMYQGENAGKIRLAGLFKYQDIILLQVYIQEAEGVEDKSCLCKYDIKRDKIDYYSSIIINDIDGWQNISIEDMRKEIRVVRHPDDFNDKKFSEKIFSKLDDDRLKYPEQKGKIEKMLKINKEKDDNPILMILHMK